MLLDEPWPFSLTALEHVELVKLLARADAGGARARSRASKAQLWQTMTARLKQVARIGRAKPLRAQPLQFAMDSGLIHGESVLLINLETCTRCDECVRACADAHDGDAAVRARGQSSSATSACRPPATSAPIPSA